jgi:hypothetical protein
VPVGGGSVPPPSASAHTVAAIASELRLSAVSLMFEMVSQEAW